jgi:hypothetical protein
MELINTALASDSVIITINQIDAAVKYVVTTTSNNEFVTSNTFTTIGTNFGLLTEPANMIGVNVTYQIIGDPAKSVSLYMPNNNMTQFMLNSGIVPPSTINKVVPAISNPVVLEQPNAPVVLEQPNAPVVPKIAKISSLSNTEIYMIVGCIICVLMGLIGVGLAIYLKKK